MKRIRVPEFLVSAVMSKPLVVAACNGKAIDISEPVAREVARRICEALSEHPQVPTDEQIRQITVIAKEKARDEPWSHSGDFWAGFYMVEWQRRCFVQEEPEIPEEIKDLLTESAAHITMSSDYWNGQLTEAFRRGLRKGEQNEKIQ